MVATGYVPSFFEEFVANKLPFPKTNFKAPEWAVPLLKKAS
jgi:pilus assembly protein CpaF